MRRMPLGGRRRTIECRGGRGIRPRLPDPSRVQARCHCADDAGRRAGAEQALLAQLGLALGPLARRHALAADREPHARPPSTRRPLHRLVGPLAAAPRAPSRRRRPAAATGATSRSTPSASSVSLRRIPVASRSLGITIRCSAQRAQDREVQPHVLDHAVVVLERDPVADAQRLGDREHDPGDQVGERLARGEADDRRGERARGEQAGRQLLEPGELARRAEDAEHDDHQPHEPADEAQPRVGLLGDPAAQHLRRRACARGAANQRSTTKATRIQPISVSSAPIHWSFFSQKSASDVARSPRHGARSLEPSCSTRWARCSRSSRRRRTCARRCSSGTGADVGEAAARARDPRGDRLLPRPPARGLGRGGAGGAARAPAPRRCAPRSASELDGEPLTEALLASLRFHAFPEVPGALAALRGRGHRAGGGLQLGRLAARAPGGDRPRAAARRRGRVAPRSAPPSRIRPPSRARWSWPARPPAEAWHVGDSPREDVEGARAAGITPVLVARDGAPPRRACSRCGRWTSCSYSSSGP